MGIQIRLIKANRNMIFKCGRTYLLLFVIVVIKIKYLQKISYCLIMDSSWKFCEFVFSIIILYGNV